MNPHGKEQNWGCATSVGYQSGSGLGGGQALSWQVYSSVAPVVEVQHYCRQLIADLGLCSPWQLCFKPEGVSVKGDNSPAAALHRDELDEGRLQCVCLLTPGAFVGCPGSHKLSLRAADTASGHYHTADEFAQKVLRETPPVTFAAGPGDLFISPRLRPLPPPPFITSSARPAVDRESLVYWEPGPGPRGPWGRTWPLGPRSGFQPGRTWAALGPEIGRSTPSHAALEPEIGCSTLSNAALGPKIGCSTRSNMALWPKIGRSTRSIAALGPGCPSAQGCPGVPVPSSPLAL